jgi:hypothetical protein
MGLSFWVIRASVGNSLFQTVIGSIPTLINSISCEIVVKLNEVKFRTQNSSLKTYNYIVDLVVYYQTIKYISKLEFLVRYL